MLMSDCIEPVNLGNPEERTIMDLAEAVIRFTGSSSEVVHRSLPVDDPKIRQPDISKAEQLLGWRPKGGVEEGLRTTIDWFRERLDIKGDERPKQG